jgi:GNAT superfamily N-acetyltransferase
VTWVKEFVELDKLIHDRASFDCNEPELNKFIQTQAAKHMKAGISTTMLLQGSELLSNGKYPICAFYTVAPSSISKKKLPKELAKKLPHYPVPVFLLAQMAVHSKYHNLGFGEITLIKALEHIWDINSRMRAYAVIVDCLNEKVEQFYLKYGFEILYKHEGRTRMFIPMTTVAQLFE